jgi:hypothetical protein
MDQALASSAMRSSVLIDGLPIGFFPVVSAMIGAQLGAVHADELLADVG